MTVKDEGKSKKEIGGGNRVQWDVDADRPLAALADRVEGLCLVGAEVEIRVEKCTCMEAHLKMPVPLRLIHWLV